MRYRLIPCIALLALVLTACSEATACPPRPDSPGTYAGWPIVLTTDHAIYAPGESLRVTIVNLSSEDILTTKRGSAGNFCPPVALQRLVGEQWQDVNDCFPGSNGQGLFRYHFVRGVAALSRPFVPLPSPGTYRFVLSYDPMHIIGNCPGDCPPTIVYSAVLRVCTCGVCS
jgi:hypothetical protein